MNFEFKVKSPKEDQSFIGINEGKFDRQYQGKVNELPLPEMERQELKAIKGKRGAMRERMNQSAASLLADQVRAIYNNRNTPG